MLDSSKLKELADNNFKFDENDRKLFETGRNTVGKEEIARYEQFLLFPQCFQKACFPRASKGVIVWEWVNPLPNHKVSDSKKLMAFAEDKLNLVKKRCNLFLEGWKVFWEKRKYLSPAFSPFPIMFPKASFIWFVKTLDCFVNGLLLQYDINTVLNK